MSVARSLFNPKRTVQLDAHSPLEKANLSHRFIFLDYLRAVSVILVVWDHLVADFSEKHNNEIFISTFVKNYVNDPLGIIQNFGWFAVCTFFLISGFIITHVSQRESVMEFIIKRFFRIFPILTLFVMLSLVLQPQLRETATWWDVIKNISLINIITIPQHIYVGVTWTLLIEVIFYALVAITMKILSPVMNVVFNLTLTILLIYTCRMNGDEYFLLSASVAYTPYLVAGQIFYYSVYRKIIGVFTSCVLALLCYATLLYGIFQIHTAFLPVTNSYLISFVYACLCFYILIKLDKILMDSTFIKSISTSSYTIYLAHAVIGYNIEVKFYEKFGVYTTVLIALIGTACVSALVNLIIERPLLRLGSRLGKRFRHRTEHVVASSRNPM